MKTVNLKKAGHSLEGLRPFAGGSGYAAVILTIASAQAVQSCLKLLKPKGRLVLFSPIPGNTPIDLFKVTIEELEIVGATNDDNFIERAALLLADRQLGIDRLITHRFFAGSIPRGLCNRRKRKGSSLKSRDYILIR